MTTIRVGTCAWADHEPFYPPGLKPVDRLAYYARFFNLVEVDATYYHLMPARNFQAWADRSPPGFVFNVKAHKAMTRHERSDRDRTDLPLDEIFARFRFSVEPLRASGKLKAIHFQFPPWFDCTRPNVGYLETVREEMEDYLVSVEFRNRTWFADRARTQATLRFLEAHEFVHVVCDEPQIGSGSVPPVPAVTQRRLVILRFHGRNEKMWYARTRHSGERFNYLYSEAELQEWVPIIHELAGGADEVHVLMNNNFANYAVRNAYQLGRLLGLDLADPLPELQALPPTDPPHGEDGGGASRAP